MLPVVVLTRGFSLAASIIDSARATAVFSASEEVRVVNDDPTEILPQSDLSTLTPTPASSRSSILFNRPFSKDTDATLVREPKTSTCDDPSLRPWEIACKSRAFKLGFAADCQMAHSDIRAASSRCNHLSALDTRIRKMGQILSYTVDVLQSRQGVT